MASSAGVLGSDAASTFNFTSGLQGGYFGFTCSVLLGLVLFSGSLRFSNYRVPPLDIFLRFGVLLNYTP